MVTDTLKLEIALKNFCKELIGNAGGINIHKWDIKFIHNGIIDMSLVFNADYTKTPPKCVFIGDSGECFCIRCQNKFCGGTCGHFISKL